MIKNFKMNDKKYFSKGNIQLHQITDDIEEFISLEKDLKNTKDKIEIANDNLIELDKEIKDRDTNPIYALGVVIAFILICNKYMITNPILGIVGASFGGVPFYLVVTAVIDKIDSKKLAKKKAIVESLENSKSIIEEKMESLKNVKGPQFIQAVEEKKEQDAEKAIVLEKLNTRKKVIKELASLSNSMDVQRYIKLTTQKQLLDEELKSVDDISEVESNAKQLIR